MSMRRSWRAFGDTCEEFEQQDSRQRLQATTARLKRILPFYLPMPKVKLFAIWENRDRLKLW